MGLRGAVSSKYNHSLGKAIVSSSSNTRQQNYTSTALVSTAVMGINMPFGFILDGWIISSPNVQVIGNGSFDNHSSTLSVARYLWLKCPIRLMHLLVG
jgi:hypothetical protein